MKYRCLHTLRAAHRLTVLCRTLGVSRSGYYAWRARPLSARAVANARLVEQMQRLHRQTHARYGARKLWQALRQAGIPCGRHRVARLRRHAGLVAQRVRRFRVMSGPRDLAPPAPNRLQQVFEAAAPDRIWAGDVTAVATRAGWLYLAVLLDVYSRRVIGWAMRPKPDLPVALQALEMALTQRRPQPGLIHHSDRGVLYTSRAYQRELTAHGLLASMSRKGNCFDNAVVESFFSTLKNELVHHHRFDTHDDARVAVFEFIEVFYNRQRLHQTLNYVSPSQFEDQRLP